MRPCSDIAPLLSGYVDGELMDDDREYVDDHLRGCEACATRRDLLLAQGGALRSRLSALAADVDFAAMTEGVMARVGRDAPVRGVARLRVRGEDLFRLHRRAFAAAGGLALAASVAAVAFLPRASGPEPRVAMAQQAQQAQIDALDFGSHDGAVLELPQGTTVIWVSEEN